MYGISHFDEMPKPRFTKFLLVLVSLSHRLTNFHDSHGHHWLDGTKVRSRFDARHINTTIFQDERANRRYFGVVWRIFWRDRFDVFWKRYIHGLTNFMEKQIGNFDVQSKGSEKNHTFRRRSNWNPNWI